MRAEEQLKAEEEEEVQEIVQDLDEGHDEESVGEQAKEDLPHAARHFNNIVLSMRAVLEGRDLDTELKSALSMDECTAFEVLQQVVSGRGRRGGFVFAEDRMQHLNQVLAVLQPALSIGTIPGIDELHGELAVVIDEVSALRDKLVALDAAEEEMDRAPEDKEAEGDKDDDDDDDEGPPAVPELGAPARPSILSTGAAVPDKVSPPSTLATGPAAPDRASSATTLTGRPEAPDVPVRPTALTGGPEAPDFTVPPSTLGDEEAAAAPAPAPTTPKPARARKVT